MFERAGLTDCDLEIEEEEWNWADEGEWRSIDSENYFNKFGYKRGGREEYPGN